MSKKHWFTAVAVASLCLAPLARAVEGDADDDSIADQDEPGDSDEDGFPDSEDDDDDNDGVPTLVELSRAPVSGDTDGDGVRDHLDPDDDGDGLSSWSELGTPNAPVDTDGDHKPDYLDSDDDGDGELTLIERASAPPEPDVDHDGVPDHLDADALGSQTPPPGCERVAFGAGRVVVCWEQDQDGDGVLSQFEANQTLVLDTDQDGTPDFLDADDDGDGLSSASEGCDPNHDGNPDDAQQTGQNVSDYLLADDDEDSIPTRDERPSDQNRDTDSDGKPDHLDDDDDGDGVDTRIEVGDPKMPYDANMDGIADYLQASVKTITHPVSGDAGVAPAPDAGGPIIDPGGGVSDAGVGSQSDASAAVVDASLGSGDDAGDGFDEPSSGAGKSSGCSTLTTRARSDGWWLALSSVLGFAWLLRRRPRARS